eukprot:TRINITY_DN17036_c0_g1_i3.p1 TRINITY_DN17036_c0_g1~~TRINITY_DN17036_c0_g1_i3.p1  ORF type:complete len:973 (+),score=233.63 TRINITY_DN17036_c0_g1_i3:181-3099(+)
MAPKAKAKGKSPAPRASLVAKEAGPTPEELEQARKESDLLRRERDEQQEQITKLSRKVVAAESLVSKVNLLIDNFSAEEQRLEVAEEHQCEALARLEEDAAARFMRGTEEQKVIDRLQVEYKEAMERDVIRGEHCTKLEHSSALALKEAASCEATSREELQVGRGRQAENVRLDFELRAAQRDRRSALEVLRLARTQLAEKGAAAEEMAAEAADEEAALAGEIEELRGALDHTSAELESENHVSRTWVSECERSRAEADRELTALRAELALAAREHKDAMASVINTSHHHVQLAESRAKERAPGILREEIEEHRAAIRVSEHQSRREQVFGRWARLYLPVAVEAESRWHRQRTLLRQWRHFAERLHDRAAASASREDLRSTRSAARRWRNAAMPGLTSVPLATPPRSRQTSRDLAGVSGAGGGSGFGFLEALQESPMHRQDPTTPGYYYGDEDEKSLSFRGGMLTAWWAHLSRRLVARLAETVRDERLRALTSLASACCASLPAASLRGFSEGRAAVLLGGAVRAYVRAWRWRELCSRMMCWLAPRERSRAVRATVAAAARERDPAFYSQRAGTPRQRWAALARAVVAVDACSRVRHGACAAVCKSRRHWRWVQVVTAALRRLSGDTSRDANAQVASFLRGDRARRKDDGEMQLILKHEAELSTCCLAISTLERSAEEYDVAYADQQYALESSEESHRYNLENCETSHRHALENCEANHRCVLEEYEANLLSCEANLTSCRMQLDLSKRREREACSSAEEMETWCARLTEDVSSCGELRERLVWAERRERETRESAEEMEIWCARLTDDVSGCSDLRGRLLRCEMRERDACASAAEMQEWCTRLTSDLQSLQDRFYAEGFGDDATAAACLPASAVQRGDSRRQWQLVRACARLRGQVALENVRASFCRWLAAAFEGRRRRGLEGRDSSLVSELRAREAQETEAYRSSPSPSESLFGSMGYTTRTRTDLPPPF